MLLLNFMWMKPKNDSLPIWKFLLHGVIPLMQTIVPIIIISIGTGRLFLLIIKKKRNPKTVTNDSIIKAKRKLKRDIIVSIIIVVIFTLLIIPINWKINNIRLGGWEDLYR